MFCSHLEDNRCNTKCSSLLAEKKIKINQLHPPLLRVSGSLNRIKAALSIAISAGNCDPLVLMTFKCISYCFCLRGGGNTFQQ